MKGGFSMLQTQEQMQFSAYQKLYDIVVPKDNILRKMKELVDFSFVHEELSKNYCLNNGRNAVSPIKMFKYLMWMLLNVQDMICLSNIFWICPLKNQ